MSENNRFHPIQQSSRQPLFKQIWEDLIFAHWPVCKRSLEKVIPYPLKLDCYEHQAWISIVFLSMSGMYVNGIPFLSLFKPFQQINVRTYVSYQGIRGVFFLKIHASNFFASRLAAFFYHLPYTYSIITTDNDQNRYSYMCSQKQRQFSPFLHAHFTIDDEEFTPHNEDFVSFLVNRYCLFIVNKHNNVYRGDLLHEPWLLRKGTCTSFDSSSFFDQNLSIIKEQPIVHYSSKKDALLWGLVKNTNK
ncbi:YqjF family protein [Cytobacillus sp. Hm23]